MNKSKWIGFDLDGTLAETIRGDCIGSPIPPMVDLLLKIHKTQKYAVKIFTARAENKEKVAQIETWLRFHGLPPLDITNVKDSGCVLIIDNIAARVYKDRGVICESCLSQLIRDFGVNFPNINKPTVNAELL